LTGKREKVKSGGRGNAKGGRPFKGMKKVRLAIIGKGGSTTKKKNPCPAGT